MEFCVATNWKRKWMVSGGATQQSECGFLSGVCWNQAPKWNQLGDIGIEIFGFQIPGLSEVGQQYQQLLLIVSYRQSGDSERLSRTVFKLFRSFVPAPTAIAAILRSASEIINCTDCLTVTTKNEWIAIGLTVAEWIASKRSEILIAVHTLL